MFTIQIVSLSWHMLAEKKRRVSHLVDGPAVFIAVCKMAVL